MIGGGTGGFDPFAMLQNLVQQQNQGPGSLFEALSREAQEAVMRAREASAGTTRTAAIGTDHLLAGIVAGDNVATEALRRAGADVDGMQARFREFRAEPGEQVYTFTPSAKRALQLSFTACRARRPRRRELLNQSLSPFPSKHVRSPARHRPSIRPLSSPPCSSPRGNAGRSSK